MRLWLSTLIPEFGQTEFVLTILLGNNMTTQVLCKQCGVPILPATSERTGGLCMACKQGIRKSIEASKRHYAEQRKYDPFRELWKSLVHRVHETDAGYEGLCAAERLYFSVGMLDGEVYNGGMHQFFSNASGSMFHDIVDGLLELKAHQALKLVLRAKDILFGDTDPPQDQEERWQAMKKYPEDHSAPVPDWSIELEHVDKAYWKDPDHLSDRLRAFAEERGLVAPFRRGAEQAD